MGARVLVIDDSPTIRSTVEWLLVGHGYEVHVAHDALTALSEIRSFGPDLILLDIRLPHVDGFELCKMIRGKSEYDFVPILMLSGLSSEEDIQRALEAGADDYITKPVNDEKLLTAIEVQLATTRSMES